MDLNADFDERVAVHAAKRALARDPSTPMIALATAHPAKFPDAVASAIGSRPKLPPDLAGLKGRKERITLLANDCRSVEDFVEKHARLSNSFRPAAKGARRK